MRLRVGLRAGLRFFLTLAFGCPSIGCHAAAGFLPSISATRLAPALTVPFGTGMSIGMAIRGALNYYKIDFVEITHSEKNLFLPEDLKIIKVPTNQPPKAAVLIRACSEGFISNFCHTDVII